MDDIITIHSGDMEYKAMKITGFSVGGLDFFVIGIPSDDKKLSLLCMQVVDGNLLEIKDEKMKKLTDSILDGMIALLNEEDKIDG